MRGLFGVSLSFALPASETIWLRPAHSSVGHCAAALWGYHMPARINYRIEAPPAHVALGCTFGRLSPSGLAAHAARPMPTAAVSFDMPNAMGVQRAPQTAETNKPVLFFQDAGDSLMGDERLSEDDDLCEHCLSSKERRQTDSRQPAAPTCGTPSARASMRSLARTSRQAGPRASINAPVARHVNPHARTYAHTRAPQLARGVRHHSRHALLRSCVPSADRRPHGACVTDAHRPVSTHPPLPWSLYNVKRRAHMACCHPRPTRVPADRTAQ